MRLLVATRNPGKKREYQDLLAGLGLELVTLNDLAIPLEVREDGETFRENALLKARGYGAASGLPTLADDSGLEVDALGGAPGVLSARYGAPAATSDEDRYRLLLAAMRSVPEGRRTARFRCAIAVAWPDGSVDLAEGTCEGSIGWEPRGTHGFGYDPVFVLAGRNVTMAELDPVEKNRVSHRARAAAALRPCLEHRLVPGSRGEPDQRPLDDLPSEGTTGTAVRS